jgi:hypothetical protein
LLSASITTDGRSTSRSAQYSRTYCCCESGIAVTATSAAKKDSIGPSPQIWCEILLGNSNSVLVVQLNPSLASYVYGKMGIERPSGALLACGRYRLMARSNVVREANRSVALMEPSDCDGEMSRIQISGSSRGETVEESRRPP